MKRPRSAGDCERCGDYATKRYGGMGRYLAMCLRCWLETAPCGGAIDDEATIARANAE